MNQTSAPGKANSYFKELFNTMERKTYSHPKILRQSQSNVEKTNSKIMNQISLGSTIVFPKSVSLQRKEKNQQRFKKAIQSINEEILQNQQFFIQAKRELLQQKRQQYEASKLQNQHKIKEIHVRVKKWSEQQKVLKQRKQKLMKEHQRKLEEEDEKQKRMEEEKKQFQKQQKLRILQQRLEKLAQNKEKRQDMMRDARQEAKFIQNPKYIEMQQKYKKMVQQSKFQEMIQKKNKKLQQKLDYQSLKEHEKKYMQKVLSTRKKQRSTSKSQEDQNQTKSTFKVYFKRDSEKVQEQKQKNKRRINFQQKLKDIPINVDEQKKIRIQIALDKSKNPFKYHFLSQKALNDFQIYNQFPDFQINIDAKQLGNNYLQQVKQKFKQSRMKKSNSVSAISTAQVQKFKYRDYLQDFKTQRKKQEVKDDYNGKKRIQPQQITQILKTHKQKSIAIDKLSQKTKEYQAKIKDKKVQLKTCHTMATSVQKNKQIDEMYMKSLKAKLACLQLN